MPFKPGSSGNPGGRPKGAKDKRWNSLERWYALILENENELSAREKITLGKWGMEILIAKMRGIDTPEESKVNVEETMKLLKEMENRGK